MSIIVKDGLPVTDDFEFWIFRPLRVIENLHSLRAHPLIEGHASMAVFVRHCLGHHARILSLRGIAKHVEAGLSKGSAFLAAVPAKTPIVRSDRRGNSQDTDATENCQ